VFAIRSGALVAGPAFVQDPDDPAAKSVPLPQGMKHLSEGGKSPARIDAPLKSKALDCGAVEMDNDVTSQGPVNDDRRIRRCRK